MSLVGCSLNVSCLKMSLSILDRHTSEQHAFVGYSHHAWKCDSLGRLTQQRSRNCKALKHFLTWVTRIHAAISRHHRIWLPCRSLQGTSSSEEAHLLSPKLFYFVAFFSTTSARKWVGSTLQHSNIECLQHVKIRTPWRTQWMLLPSFWRTRYMGSCNMRRKEAISHQTSLHEQTLPINDGSLVSAEACLDSQQLLWRLHGQPVSQTFDDPKMLELTPRHEQNIMTLCARMMHACKHVNQPLFQVPMPRQAFWIAKDPNHRAPPGDHHRLDGSSAARTFGCLLFLFLADTWRPASYESGLPKLRATSPDALWFPRDWRGVSGSHSAPSCHS